MLEERIIEALSEDECLLDNLLQHNGSIPEIFEILGSHGDEFECERLLGYSAL
jgi:hypothetical protein